jgi:type IV secretory pathway protease TraF
MKVKFFEVKFFAAVLFFCASLLGIAYFSGVRVNFTSSLPQRFWFVRPLGESEEIRRGEYVVVPPPGIDTARFDRRTKAGYFDLGKMPFLKEVFALPEETVADGVFPLVSSDSEGRPLPGFPLPIRLERDEYWLGSLNERGFDSRYFGPVKRRAIAGKAVPIF